MYLNRVRVKDYKVLKNLDITFERDFNPWVFPLGGNQGCGKSLLLSLIYASSLHEMSDSIDCDFCDKEKGKLLYFVERSTSRNVCAWTYLDLIKHQKIADLINKSYAQQKYDAIVKFASTVQNSVILLDDLDLGFHPDNQYKIGLDLVDAGKTNQYIIATHSFELCEALTPSHIKVIKNTVNTAPQTALPES